MKDSARRTVTIKQIVALTVAVGILAVVVWLAIQPMSATPVVVNLKSDAVAFVPAENVNLVTSARPRHGILASGEIYEGIRFDPPPYLSSVSASFHAETPGPEGADATGMVVLKHLEVTPGCEVRIERLSDARIDLEIRPDPLAAREAERLPDRKCAFQAEITSVGDASPMSIRRSLAPGEEVELRFRPSDRPLQFRRLKVRDLGFTEKGEHGLRSAILGGTLRLPEHGNHEERVEFGDRLRFGERVRGDILGLSLGDTLRTIFKGTVSQPVIENRSLGPSVLRHLYHDENARIIAGVILGALGLIFAWFQID